MPFVSSDAPDNFADRAKFLDHQNEDSPASLLLEPHLRHVVAMHFDKLEVFAFELFSAIGSTLILDGPDYKHNTD
jgi:hypothetical protein